MNKNNNKKIICNHWKKNNCKFMNSHEKCTFAHGEYDIIKEKCLNDIYCWNEECNFEHPNGWNPYDNKKDCLICLDSKIICDKENKKYKHVDKIVDGIIDIKKEEIIKEYSTKLKDVNIFPVLVKTKEKEIKNDNEKYKYSEILTNNIKDDLNIMKNNNQKNDDSLYLDNINNDTSDIDIVENNEIPKVNITINSFDIDNDFISDNSNTKILIENMEREFKMYSEKIKTNINGVIKNDRFAFLLINNLNEISSMINLFKNNYKDIIN